MGGGVAAAGILSVKLTAGTGGHRVSPSSASRSSAEGISAFAFFRREVSDAVAAENLPARRARMASFMSSSERAPSRAFWRQMAILDCSSGFMIDLSGRFQWWQSLIAGLR